MSRARRARSVAFGNRSLNLAHIVADTAHAEHAALFVDNGLELLGSEAVLGHQECERAGVYVAYAGTHHKALDRGETHRGVDTFATDNGGHRRTVAYMAGDDALLGRVYA